MLGGGTLHFSMTGSEVVRQSLQIEFSENGGKKRQAALR
jgi:hypothetical protein